MLLKMKLSTSGSPDGISVKLYEYDKEYDVPEKLAEIFLAEGLAVSAEEVIEEKSLGAAPMNKMAATPKDKKVEKKEDKEEEDE